MNYQGLHDPHMIPEPILVASGTTYLVPAYIAYMNGYTYTASSLVAITFTTMTFHATRQEWLFSLDLLAILNYLACLYHNSTYAKTDTRYLAGISVAYSLNSYFIGRVYKNMSFDPDWNKQMLFHSLMHVLTAYGATGLLLDRIHYHT
jgi:hypothetical protein